MTMPTLQAPFQKPWVLLFLSLGALWGASFLFMRFAALEFGPLPTTALRMAIAALALLPLIVARGLVPQLLANKRHMVVIGMLNGGIPSACYAFAVLHINTGLSAILNATSPMFAALIGWLWLSQRLTHWRIAGLAIGFVGVVLLAGEQAALKGDALWLSLLAMLLCLMATLCYGITGNYSKRYLGHIDPLVTAGGTLLGASLVLAVPAWLTWPSAAPSLGAWGAVTALALLCTAVAFVLYFELIRRTDALKTMSVTYVIPVFALLYGVVFLDEHITLWMVLSGLVVVLGTALATGLIRKNPSVTS